MTHVGTVIAPFGGVNAAGSGTTVAELNTLLNKFAQMQKMMKRTGKFQRMKMKMGGGVPGLMGR